ncbi:hypothetical protein [Ruminococcus flavefaciens]|uniref:hypothetical protein n=1 Tax=Ruminococcus flavefaciens TaxID=1265 RepID=UPI00048C12C8|nr:hypothetical protein [Ruminococcus flavefaciens]
MEEMSQQTNKMTTAERASAKELRRLELEQAFGNYHFVVIRKELFAHLRDPAVVIRNGSITFNTACINDMEDVVYVQLLMCEEEKKFAVKACHANDKDALRWCIEKPDKRKSRKMTCPDFTKKLFKLMNWDTRCRYKILGYKIDFEDEAYYVFDLIVKETFREKPKKGEVVTEPIDTRKGYYSDDIANTFGIPLEEHRKQTLVSENNGYINVAMLTGNQKPVEEKQLTLPETNEASQYIPTLYYGETVQKGVAEETEAHYE